MTDKPDDDKNGVPSVEAIIKALNQKFDEAARGIPPENVAAHRALAIHRSVQVNVDTILYGRLRDGESGQELVETIVSAFGGIAASMLSLFGPDDRAPALASLIGLFSDSAVRSLAKVNETEKQVESGELAYNEDGIAAAPVVVGRAGEFDPGKLN